MVVHTRFRGSHFNVHYLQYYIIQYTLLATAVYRYSRFKNTPKQFLAQQPAADRGLIFFLFMTKTALHATLLLN